MKQELDFSIHSQPTDSTCGPTCLHAVYRYWGDSICLDETISHVGGLESGGTLAVQLALHALRRGYQATLQTYNLRIFDPSWFIDDSVDLVRLLQKQLTVKSQQPDRPTHEIHKLKTATEAYCAFVEMGGRLEMPSLDENLIIGHLAEGRPILCGLSASYLYHEQRERSHEPDESGNTSTPDEIGGDPVGHFVVLYGYDPQTCQVLIADPLHSNPFGGGSRTYTAPLAEVTTAILLGIVTYDANLLTISPTGFRSQ